MPDTQNLTKGELLTLGNRLLADINELWAEIGSKLDCGNQMVDLEEEPHKQELSLIFDKVFKTLKCLENVLRDLKKGLRIHSLKTFTKCFTNLSELVNKSDEPEPTISQVFYKAQRDEEEFLKGIQV